MSLASKACQSATLSISASQQTDDISRLRNYTFTHTYMHTWILLKKNIKFSPADSRLKNLLVQLEPSDRYEIKEFYHVLHSIKTSIRITCFSHSHI